MSSRSVRGGQLTGAYKDRLGRIYCRTPNGIVSRYDTSGKLLGSFNTFADYGWLDLQPNGNLLWSQNTGNKVCEYDRNGKQILDLNIPNAKTVTGLVEADQHAARRGQTLIGLVGLGGILPAGRGCCSWAVPGAGPRLREPIKVVSHADPAIENRLSRCQGP
jgi:hypothetical protein